MHLNDDHTPPDETPKPDDTPSESGDTYQNHTPFKLPEPTPPPKRAVSFFRGNKSTPRPARPRRVLRRTVFHIVNTDDHQMFFDVASHRRASATARRRVRGWQVDFGTLNVQMNDLGRFIAVYRQQDNTEGRAAWRHTAEQIGIHLFHGLLNVDEGLSHQLINTRRWTRPPERLFFVFEGPRNYLSVPYELLHDGDVPFVVEHPVIRRLAHITPNHKQPFDDLIIELQEAENPLRVLLIPAGGPGAAEDECAAIYTMLAQQARQLGVPIEIDVLTGRDMQLDAVRVKLLQCDYHIVHIAGQVFHNRTTPEEGGLLFAGAHAMLGQELLTIRELRTLLTGSATRLFFVSAPIAPQHWNEHPVMRDGDYLDVLAALVQVGIPYVLGFRWYVVEASKQQFATAFYEGLLKAPAVPELAILHARRTLYKQDQQDEIWASPLLIAQILHDTDQR